MKAGIGIIFEIAGYEAKASGVYDGEEGIIIQGQVKIKEGMDFSTVLEKLFLEMGISLNLTMLPKIAIESIRIGYLEKSKLLEMGLLFCEDGEELGSVYVLSKLAQKETEVLFLYQKKFYLSDLPMAGDWIGKSGNGIGPIRVTCGTDGSVLLEMETVFTGERTSLCIPLNEKKERNLLAEQNEISGVSWKEWKKTLGCFTILAVGGAFKEGCIYLMLRAELQIQMIKVSLEGLGLKIPFSNLKETRPILSGLGLGIKTDAIEISGAFAKALDKESYTGSLVVKFKKWNFSLMGGYDCQPYTSIFAAGIVNFQMGTMGCFTLIGIAAGFGYNRSLTIPEIDHLDEFAIMKIMHGTLSPGQAAASILPSQGNHWLTAGIQFTAYHFIKGDAVLSLQLGKQTQIDITGQAVMDFSLKNVVLAHITFLIHAMVSMEESLIAVTAAIGGNSYLLSKDCHVTGGFAFRLWYDGAHKGDFVITLGGYHRNYKKPKHYPSTAPLGLNWQITKDLLLQGKIYFALTPGSLMAGGALEILFDKGWLRAWCSARMDILIQWKPFSYDFYMEVSLGISVKVVFIRVKLEIGCSFHIWGPDFSIVARIKLWIVSFEISHIKSKRQENKKLEWNTFEETYLQKKNAKKKMPDAAGFSAGGIQITGGLLAEGADKEYRVRSEGLEIEIHLNLPITAYSINGENTVLPENKYLGIYPCEEETLCSELEVTFVELADADKFGTEQIKWNLLESRVPSALWGNSKGKNKNGEWISDTITAYNGLQFKIEKKDYKETMVSLIALIDEGDKGEPIITPKISGESYEQNGVYDILAEINQEEKKKIRKELFAEMGFMDADMFGSAWSNANEIRDIFREPPMLHTLGA